MTKFNFKQILTSRNRGILLDVFTFFVNLILMIVLTRSLADIASQSRAGDPTAKALTGLFCLGICFWSPVGAILKRRRAHLRGPGLKDINGCFLLLYFVSQIMFAIFGVVLLGESIETFSNDPNISQKIPMPVFMLLLVAAMINSAIFYFYFQPPKRKPFWNFLATPRAELIGDVCLFFNMVFYQMLWGYLIAEMLKDYSGIADRIYMFVFLGIFIYLPPRLFYLGEDGKRKLTWLTILLALSPIIFRIFFHSSQHPVN